LKAENHKNSIHDATKLALFTFKFAKSNFSWDFVRDPSLGKLTAFPLPTSCDKGRTMNRRKKKDFEGEGRGERENTGE